jgi:hypothetical protein
MCQQLTAPHHFYSDDGDRTGLRKARFLYPALTPLRARERFSGEIKHYKNNHRLSFVLWK